MARQLRRIAGRSVALFARGPSSTVPQARAAHSVFIVKDWTPAGAHLLGRSAADLEHEILSMCRAADSVCAVTETLRETLRARGVESHLLRHGFAADLAPAFDAAESPAALRDLPRPLIGYAGRLDDRLDWPALHQVARRHSDATLVLIGPVSPRLPHGAVAGLRELPNAVFLGAVERAALPAHLAALDCCLLPYRSSPWLAHASPLKLWECLYAGAPIVGSGCEALREYAEFVDYVPGEDLPEAIGRALTRDRGGDVERRRRFALANTWDQRAGELLTLAGQAAATGR